MAINKPELTRSLQLFLNRFKVHYDEENDSEQEHDGEIILLVPRKDEKCLDNEFPQHSTANQFFTPRMFEAYHEEGIRACEDAKLNYSIDND